MYAHGLSDSEMPLLRYFLFVGGALLVLLFTMDAVLPEPPANESIVSRVELPAIRVHSERKGPEAVVLDTNQPMIERAVTAREEAAAAPPTAVMPEPRLRESFAQFIPPQPKQIDAGDPKRPKPQPKHVVARTRINHRAMRIAQRPHSGFFDTTW